MQQCSRILPINYLCMALAHAQLCIYGIIIIHSSHWTTYVTGYWKTDHNVTLDQLHFIGPANSHTHALSMHWCITGLSWLVCFSRAGFADCVKSRLRQWDPWRALDGRCGSDIHPCVGETSLKALQSCLGVWLALLGLIATPNSPVGWCNPPPASHPPPPPPTRPPPYTCNPWYYSGWEKSCSKSSSASKLL